MTAEPEHILLLGDSIIDNLRYVPPGQPCVQEQLEAAIVAEGLPWQVTQAARDGAVMANVYNTQFYDSPRDPTVIVVSAGGNDGLAYLRQLRRALWPTLKSFRDTFRAGYEKMLAEIKATFPGVPLVVCTIYQAQFGDEFWWITDSIASIGVRVLNSIIRSIAAERGLPLLDLWYIFDRREDFANAIEPGVPGGHKLVRNLMTMVKAGDHKAGKHVAYADPTYDPAFAPTIPHVSHFKTQREVFAGGVVG
jgi:lysophospholipase L1-like esterase